MRERTQNVKTQSTRYVSSEHNRPRVVRAFVLPLLMAALVAAVTGCGDKKSDAQQTKSSVTCVATTVNGAGSTFVANIEQKWASSYQQACANAVVNYKSNGSGAGIQNFVEGTVDFAGSDVLLTEKEQATLDAKYGAAYAVPWSAGGVAVEYKLAGVNELRLTPEVLAEIFAGKITKWNDTKIAATNTNVKLPDAGIQVVHRSDSSGTTAVFTEFLKTTAPSVWTVGAGKDVPWPAGQGAKGSDGVTQLVKSTEGAIGYAELSYAKSSGLSIAKLKNEAGNFVGADQTDGVTAAMAEATTNAKGALVANFKPKSEKAYPVSTFTYVIVGKKLSDPNRAALVKAFVTYALKDGQNDATALSYAPLPSSIVDKSIEMLNSIESAAPVAK